MKKILLFSALLAGLSVATYGRVANHEFLYFDDDKYIFQNPQIQQGINPQSLKWALTADLLFDSPHTDYWQPATFLSRLIDVELFGLDPRGHHVTNLILHTFNVILLFIFLVRLSGSPVRSAVVAAVFATHPLQVEAVAWVTARKDLLSVLFALLALNAYVGCLYAYSLVRRFWVMLCFVLSLMAKPMMITLPLVFILVDLWWIKQGTAPAAQQYRAQWRSVLKKSVVSKWPYFLISLIYLPVPFLVQKSVTFTLVYSNPIVKSLSAYLFYLKKMVVPLPLYIYGPVAHLSVPVVETVIAAVCLLGVIALSVVAFKKYYYFTIGWAWFLITLLPVSGQGWPADRFMYFPMVGLVTAAVWGCAHALERFPRLSMAGAGLAAIILVSLSMISYRQVACWKDNETFFRHTLEHNKENYLVLHNLGYVLMNKGEDKQAFDHFLKALSIQPRYTPIYTNLGILLTRQHKILEAMEIYHEGLRIKPDAYLIHNNLGSLYFEVGKHQEALWHYNKALEINPQYVAALYNKQLVLSRIQE